MTAHGSDWLWAVFCVMTASAIIIFVLGQMTRPVGERAFHELACALCATASVACEFPPFPQARAPYGDCGTDSRVSASPLSRSLPPE